MAEIRKRGDTYQITVFLGRDNATQKKITKMTTFIPTETSPKKIEQEVQNFAMEYERAVKDGESFDGDKVTFSQFLEVWKENFLSQKSKRVQESYLRYIEGHFSKTLGGMKLSKIRATHIDSIIHDMERKGYAPKTIHNVFTGINSVFRYAYKKGIIKENPCSRCDDLPTIKRDTELHYFTVDQAKTFLNALTLPYSEKRDPVTRHLKDGTEYEVSGYTMQNYIPFQWRAYFSIAIYGGFRRQEIVALTWEDIDFDKREIDINKAMGKAFKSEFIKETKTPDSVRKITLPGETFELLRQWKKEEQLLSIQLGSAWTGFRGKEFNKNYVFIDLRNGNHISIDTPTHKFREILDLYNSQYAIKDEDKLPLIRLHDLRHTSATLLLSNNVDVMTVSKRLGHSKPSVTLDIYAHAMKDTDTTASDTLERLFEIG